ncbi:hypothetical protein G7048_07745 [Diaphorobacter sp. HDW4B]|uniref:hypothetical protein n=1 Tax=Diaphorobacter sp. HDW4B TaxID=2714925 RepID=UPI00140BABF5|nr:hypothetical protein [Diaphorobacter sp. HDW4B]QIL70256.1 hypothetical protein G7048_07745 [Diaphorobacter sp. HDW4B]
MNSAEVMQFTDEMGEKMTALPFTFNAVQMLAIRSECSKRTPRHLTPEQATFMSGDTP